MKPASRLFSGICVLIELCRIEMSDTGGGANTIKVLIELCRIEIGQLLVNHALAHGFNRTL